MSLIYRREKYFYEQKVFIIMYLNNSFSSDSPITTVYQFVIEGNAIHFMLNVLFVKIPDSKRGSGRNS